LAPLTQPFGRSSSTSTIKGGDSAEETPISTQRPNLSLNSANDIGRCLTASEVDMIALVKLMGYAWRLMLFAPADSEALVSPPVAPVKPGILIVTLHEGQGFSLSPHYQQIFASHFQNANNAYSTPIRPNSSSSHVTAHAQSNTYAQTGRPQSTSGGINAAPTIHGRYSSKYLPYALLDFEKNQVFVDAVSGTPENPLWAGDNTSYKFDVSRQTELSVQLYLRNPAARPGSGRSEDIFLGAVRVQPRFEEAHLYVDDPKLSKKDNQKAAAAHAEKERTLGQLGAEWLDLQFGTGSIKVGVSFVENRGRSMKLEDFELLKVVGKGSFGKVMQVMYVYLFLFDSPPIDSQRLMLMGNRKKDTGRIYALKTIRKAHIISRSEVSHTLAERSVLAQINNPFIVPLKFSFQSPEKLYLVLAFVNGGELFHHLQREQRFDINRARFYTAELLCALECLHGFKVIYRDLKPENILLDYTGHIALCDFGLCKLDMKDEDRTNSNTVFTFASLPFGASLRSCR
jgi:serum/glucocorticoid-regulated kinase 2